MDGNVSTHFHGWGGFPAVVILGGNGVSGMSQAS